MTELEPLSPELIRRYLDADGAAYDVDEDGDFVFEYDPDPDSGCTLTVYLSITERDWYSIVIANERTFQRADWERLVWLCNTWNAEEMYPMAYLLADPATPDEADIFLDHTYIAKFGISQEQLQHLTEEIIDSAFAFWDWAHSEHRV